MVEGRLGKAPDGQRERSRDREQQLFAPALKKKLDVRSSLGGGAEGTGLDGMRGRSYGDQDDRDRDRDAYRGGRGIAGISHRRSYGDDRDDEGEEEAELDVVRPSRRASTSNAAVRSAPAVVGAEKRVHTAGAAVPAPAGSRSRYDSRPMPSMHQRSSSPALLSRYAPARSAAAVPYQSDDEDTADEGSDREGEERVEPWLCKNKDCSHVNTHAVWCEACSTPRTGGFSRGMGMGMGVGVGMGVGLKR
jgi:hypothetical protein